MRRRLYRGLGTGDWGLGRARARCPSSAIACGRGRSPPRGAPSRHWRSVSAPSPGSRPGCAIPVWRFRHGRSAARRRRSVGPQRLVILDPPRRPGLEEHGIGLRSPQRRVQRPRHPVVLAPHEHRVARLDLRPDGIEIARHGGRREVPVASHELERIRGVRRGVHPAARRVVAAQIAFTAEVVEQSIDEGCTSSAARNGVATSRAAMSDRHSAENERLNTRSSPVAPSPSSRLRTRGPAGGAGRQAPRPCRGRSSARRRYRRPRRGAPDRARRPARSSRPGGRPPTGRAARRSRPWR